MKVTERNGKRDEKKMKLNLSKLNFGAQSNGNPGNKHFICLKICYIKSHGDLLSYSVVQCDCSTFILYHLRR